MPSAFVFYHFLYPDQIVSSVHFSELCTGLADRGWQVTGFAGNRDSADIPRIYPPQETWRRVIFRRFWRPNWRHFDARGRVLNALWMIACWSSLALQRDTVPDVIVMGTDPVLSVFIAPIWRFFHPEVRIVHWCFDLYPEAAYADGVISRGGRVSRILEVLLKRAYRSCDLIVDIGSCMRKLLEMYEHGRRTATLVPWALAEPQAPLTTAMSERYELFGDAVLALMYSGSFGRAHSYEDFIDLMRHLKEDSAHLVLSVKGSRAEALRQIVEREQSSISFAPFASEALLSQRLASADIHIISLREEWTGTVVPSKFFGALAVGRPVLFCGSRESCVAKWIEEYQLGWVLEPGRAEEVAFSLREMLQHPADLIAMRERCHRVYHEKFSREHVVSGWHKELTEILESSTYGV